MKALCFFSYLYSSFRRDVVLEHVEIKCLVLERESAANMYRKTVNVYERGAFNESSVKKRWVKRVKGCSIETGQHHQ